MAIDFGVINDENVGYQLAPRQSRETLVLTNLLFKEFIPPYTYRARTPESVYNRLGVALKASRRQQESVTDGQRSVMLDILAKATLEREAMMNAQRLILENYL